MNPADDQSRLAKAADQVIRAARDRADGEIARRMDVPAWRVGPAAMLRFPRLRWWLRKLWPPFASHSRTASAVATLTRGLNADAREALLALDSAGDDTFERLPVRLDEAVGQLAALGLAIKGTPYADFPVSAITPAGRIVAEALTTEFGTPFGTRGPDQAVSGADDSRRRLA